MVMLGNLIGTVVAALILLLVFGYAVLFWQQASRKQGKERKAWRRRAVITAVMTVLLVYTVASQ
jgi:heme/copper-type cytochrome/quinol oxidase subunit 2